MRAEQMCPEGDEGLATPEKRPAPSIRQRGTRRGGSTCARAVKGSADGPRVKRHRAGNTKNANVPSSAEEECMKAPEVSNSSQAMVLKSQDDVLRIQEPGADYPVVQLTGHLPGSRKIPAWMQVYSSVGRAQHSGQPAYSSQDEQYLLYHSCGPGVAQGWWLGRVADGTESSAALAFLPNANTDWWVLDKGAPRQAQVIITTVRQSPDAPGLKAQPETSLVPVEADSLAASSNMANAQSAATLLRLTEPGAGHATIQLTGHLPGECRIPAWMQVYNSMDKSLHPDGQSTYASQDGNYLLYPSSGPGVGQGWWLGRAADGIASEAALAFLPRGHEDWWVLDQGTPHEAHVIITTHKPPQEESLSQDSEPALPIRLEEQPTLPLADIPALPVADAMPDAPVLPEPKATRPQAVSALQPVSAPLPGHKVSTEAAPTSRAPAIKPPRTTTNVDAQVASRRSASSVGAPSRSSTYSNSIDRIARSASKSTSSTNSIERKTRDLNRDAIDSIERIAGLASGSPSESIERIARSPSKGGGNDSIDGRNSTALERAAPDAMLSAPIVHEADRSDTGATALIRRGICSRELQLVIAPVDGTFLNLVDLKRQDKFLRSFQKLSMKLESTAASSPFAVAAM